MCDSRDSLHVVYHSSFDYHAASIGFGYVISDDFTGLKSKVNSVRTLVTLMKALNALHGENDIDLLQFRLRQLHLDVRYRDFRDVSLGQPIPLHPTKFVTPEIEKTGVHLLLRRVAPPCRLQGGHSSEDIVAVSPLSRPSESQSQPQHL